jgi:tRNA-dihydrouridine synthase A
MRLISKKATLYTEMLHHEAVVHNHKHVLQFSPLEHPIVLQLGGCDPKGLAEAAKIG